MKSTYRVDMVAKGTGEAHSYKVQAGSIEEARVRAVCTAENETGLPMVKAHATFLRSGIITYAETFGGKR